MKTWLVVTLNLTYFPGFRITRKKLYLVYDRIVSFALLTEMMAYSISMTGDFHNDAIGIINGLINF